MPALVRRSVFLAALLVNFSSFLVSQTQYSWPFAGQSNSGRWSQSNETTLIPSTVPKLAPKWVFTTTSDVSATPTVAGTTVFFPDWGGYLYAVNKDSGVLVWSHQLSEYTGIDGTVSRSSPALYNGLVIVGDRVPNGPPHMMAVNQQTGAPVWVVQVDTHPQAVITDSPVVANGRVYVGISSREEGTAADPSYPCCTFRGSIIALDAMTGAKLWQTYTVPDNGGVQGGYSGGGVWSTPAIDLSRNSLYVGTGDNYTVPSSVATCLAADPESMTCNDPSDYFDSILSVDLTTGDIKWGHKVYGYDAWNTSCNHGMENCPDPQGPDQDFASGPNLIGNIVGVAQKSGSYYALNPDTGAIVWTTFVGAGKSTWGSATDGSRIYFGVGDSGQTEYPLFPSGQRISWGSWTALDVNTGKILWQTADPVPGSADSGSVSIAHGVLYAGSLDSDGHMYAINASTGRILWSFASGGSVLGAPSIVDGTLYWGSGYRRGYTGNNKLYAFALGNTPVVSIKTPWQNMASNSPVHFSASASTTCAGGIASMEIFTGGSTPAFSTTSASLSTYLALPPGVYNTVVQTADNCGGSGKLFTTINVVNCPPPSTNGIRFCAPASGTTIASPLQVIGSTKTSGSANIQLFVDGTLSSSAPGKVFSQLLRLPSGSHVLTLTAINSLQTSYSVTQTVNVQ
jgi:polyvinyl alcohol dehydrogenase (cytochrome)